MALSLDQMIDQIAGLKRRVSVLEAENVKFREAVSFTLRTLDLHRDPEANPLAKMIDRGIAEGKLREAIGPHSAVPAPEPATAYVRPPYPFPELGGEG